VRRGVPTYRDDPCGCDNNRFFKPLIFWHFGAPEVFVSISFPDEGASTPLHTGAEARVSISGPVRVSPCASAVLASSVRVVCKKACRSVVSPGPDPEWLPTAVTT
jgi:hypothetical protein